MRYSGELGFVLTQETTAGVWVPKTIVRQVTGTVEQRAYRWEDTQTINANLDITNQLSIVYDSFLTQNMFAMRWATWMGKKWNITRIDIRPPRMILYLGKEYIEEEDHDRTESR